MENTRVPLVRDGSTPVDAADLAAHYFGILNGMSSKEWFVDCTARETVIDEYIDFIENRGVAAFKWFAERQVAANNGWSNNIAFRKCLRREITAAIDAQASAVQRLNGLGWLARSHDRDQILDAAARCTKPEWVIAKAEFIDAIDVSNSEKAERFRKALESEVGGNA